jgi:hypothetical protein
MIRITTIMLLALLASCDENNYYCPPKDDQPQAPVNDPDTGVFNPPVCECPPDEEPEEPTPHDCPPGGAPVPEPGTMFLVGSGLAAGAAFSRRRKKRQEASKNV